MMNANVTNTDLCGSLAVLGAPAAFSAKVHVGSPNIGDKERLMARFSDIIDRRWFTNNGEYLLQFEKHLCDYLGVKNCIVMCNATIALEIAARSLDLHGEVIVPSFTFVATPHSLQWQQITPVFCDVDPNTHNIDPDRIEALVTPRTTGIVAVHVWGRACDTERIEEIARRRKLKVMYDAAHAFGCSHMGRMLGNYGDVEVFSFHATKFFNTFEGGAIATNNDELAAKIRLMRNFGFTGVDRVDYVGINGKMTEVCAAMGVTSLESVQLFIDQNRRNWDAYSSSLSGVEGLRLMRYDDAEKYNYQYIVVELQDGSPLTRDELVQVLHAENVLARKYFHPGCHEMEPYRSYFPHAGLLLPETCKLTRRVMTLPNGTAVNDVMIGRICEIIRTAFVKAQEVRTALKKLLA